MSAVTEIAAADTLSRSPARSAETMEADLRSLLASVQDRHLSALLARVFGEGSQLWARYRTAPAAKRYHQAYCHGLLEHCLTVAEAVSAVAATFPEVDRNLAVAGALLHDIGKLETYGEDLTAIDFTDVGRLQGEIALGYYIVRQEIERVDGFPQELAWQVLHIVLSHHGALEYGSPVVPCTREATLVHMIDNLGGRLGSFDRLQHGLDRGQRWSAFDHALRASAFFPGRPGNAFTAADQRRAA